MLLIQYKLILLNFQCLQAPGSPPACRSTIHLGQRTLKERIRKRKCPIAWNVVANNIHERNPFPMGSSSQDMKYRQSLVELAIHRGVGKAPRWHKRARSTICFWLERYDGSLASLACPCLWPQAVPDVCLAGGALRFHRVSLTTNGKPVAFKLPGSQGERQRFSIVCNPGRVCARVDAESV